MTNLAQNMMAAWVQLAGRARDELIVAMMAPALFTTAYAEERRVTISHATNEARRWSA